MSLITLRQIQLHFGEQPLLDNVDLTIEAGERLCLVGRNGSGKSTPVSYTHLTLPTKA